MNILTFFKKQNTSIESPVPEKKKTKKTVRINPYVTLMRHAMKGISYDDVDPFDNLTSIDKEIHLAECDSIAKNETFKLVIESLIKEQRRFSTEEAGTLVEINFGRAQISGISLVKDVFETKSLEYQEILEKRRRIPMQEIETNGDPSG